MDEWNLADEKTLAALKEASKETEDNYLIIKFKYYDMVLPYKAGLSVLANLNKAEAVEDIEYNYRKVSPIDDFTIESTIISKEEYINMKMRHILRITKKPEKVTNT